MRSAFASSLIAWALLIAVPAPSSAASLGDAELKSIRENYQLCVGKLKGPYTQNMCLCEDGTLVPVTGADGRVLPQPCGSKGFRFCSAFRAPWAEALGRHGLHIGNLFARDLYQWDSFGDHHDLVRGYILENYFVETHPGHKFAELRAYGGLAGAEYEAVAAPQFFERYLGLPSFDDFRHYLLAYELQRRFFVRRDLGRIDRVRALSSRLQAGRPAFKPLRDAIHNQLSASLIPKVTAFRDGLPPAADRAPYDELIGELEKLTRLGPDDLQRQIETFGDPALRGSMAALLPDNSADPADQVIALGNLMAESRRAVSSRRAIPADARRLIDLSITAAAVIQTRCTGLLEAEAPLSIGRYLDLLAALTRAAYGSGLLSGREMDAAVADLERLKSKPEHRRLELYRALKRTERVAEWAQSTVRFSFAEVMAAWTAVMPEVAYVGDDILRASPLLPYAGFSRKLIEHVSAGLGVDHVLAGEAVQSGVKALNPGLALAELRVIPAHGSYTRDQVLALIETPAELEPAAGILTMGEGNVVSHVQLLARALGIPNAVLSPGAFQRLRPLDGERVLYLVTPGGRVVLKRASAMTDQERRLVAEFNRNRKRAADGALGQAGPKLRIDVQRLELGDRAPIDLAAARRSESGARYGPKAAFLGELKRIFPGRVTRGVVLPFGIYHEHYQRAVVSVPGELKARALAADGEPLPGFVERTYGEFFGRLVPAGTTEEELAAWIRPRLEIIRHSIRSTPPAPEFREALRREFRRQGLFLGHHEEETVGCFVRSDTNVEDLDNFNGAGLNLTLFNLRSFSRILDGIREVWASPFTYRSFSWRQTLIDEPLWVLPSIVILESVSSEKSGVLITADPETGDASRLLAATSEGVGGAVDGTSAETILWSASGVELLTQFKSPWRRLLRPDGGSEITASTGRPAVLEEKELEQLTAAAATLTSALKPVLDPSGNARPWDVEYGFNNGKLWLFQVRPFVGNDEVANIPALRELDRMGPGAKTMITLSEAVR